MEKRMTTICAWLHMQGYADTMKDIADKIGSSQPNISAARKGRLSEDATRRLMHRINAAFNNPFSAQWIEDGTGKMLAANITQIGDGNHAANIHGNNTQTNMPAQFADLLANSQKQIDTLLAQQGEFLRVITSLTCK